MSSKPGKVQGKQKAKLHGQALSPEDFFDDPPTPPQGTPRRGARVDLDELLFEPSNPFRPPPWDPLSSDPSLLGSLDRQHRNKISLDLEMQNSLPDNLFEQPTPATNKTKLGKSTKRAISSAESTSLEAEDERRLQSVRLKSLNAPAECCEPVVFKRGTRDLKIGTVIFPTNAFCFGFLVTSTSLRILDLLRAERPKKAKKENKGEALSVSIMIDKEPWEFFYRTRADGSKLSAVISLASGGYPGPTSLIHKKRIYNYSVLARSQKHKTETTVEQVDPFSFLHSDGAVSSIFERQFRPEKRQTIAILFLSMDTSLRPQDYRAREQFGQYLTWHFQEPVVEIYRVLNDLHGVCDDDMKRMTNGEYIAWLFKQACPKMTVSVDCSDYGAKKGIYRQKIDDFHNDWKRGIAVDFAYVNFHTKMPMGFGTIVGPHLTLILTAGNFLSEKAFWYGCDIQTRIADFITLGVQVIAVGSGTAEMAAKWASRVNWEFPIFLNQQQHQPTSPSFSPDIDHAINIALGRPPVSLDLFHIDYGYISQFNAFQRYAKAGISGVFQMIYKFQESLHFFCPEIKWPQELQAVTIQAIESKILNCPPSLHTGTRTFISDFHVSASRDGVKYEHFKFYLFNDLLLVTQASHQDEVYQQSIKFNSNFLVRLTYSSPDNIIVLSGSGSGSLSEIKNMKRRSKSSSDKIKSAGFRLNKGSKSKESVSVSEPILEQPLPPLPSKKEVAFDVLPTLANDSTDPCEPKNLPTEPRMSIPTLRTSKAHSVAGEKRHSLEKLALKRKDDHSPSGERHSTQKRDGESPTREWTPSSPPPLRLPDTPPKKKSDSTESPPFLSPTTERKALAHDEREKLLQLHSRKKIPDESASTGTSPPAEQQRRGSSHEDRLRKHDQSGSDKINLSDKPRKRDDISAERRNSSPMEPPLRPQSSPPDDKKVERKNSNANDGHPSPPISRAASLGSGHGEHSSLLATSKQSLDEYRKRGRNLKSPTLTPETRSENSSPQLSPSQLSPSESPRDPVYVEQTTQRESITPGIWSFANSITPMFYFQVGVGDVDIQDWIGHVRDTAELYRKLEKEKEMKENKKSETHRNFTFKNDTPFFYEPLKEEFGFYLGSPVELECCSKVNGIDKPDRSFFQEYKTYLTNVPNYGPFCVLLQNQGPSLSSRKTYVVSPTGAQSYLIPSTGQEKSDNILDIILQISFHKESFPEGVIQFKEVPTEPILPMLFEALNKAVDTNFKFGVLSSPKAGIVTEDDLYNENNISPNFYEFLNCLGHKTAITDDSLVFNGGLSDAEYFYSSTHGHNAIALHVGPFITFSEDEPSRKRHVGNDISVIIFQETDQILDLSSFCSKFNHIFIIVKKLPQYQETVYSVNVMAKQGVASFPPYLDGHNLFTTSKIKDFLFPKLINGEINALSKLSAFKGRQLIRWNMLSTLFASFGVDTEKSNIWTNPKNR